MRARPFAARACVILAAALAAGVAACGTGSLDKVGDPVPRPVILTLAEGDDNFASAQPFADAVQEVSHGALQIKIESPWRPRDPYYESDLIKDVQAGKAQLGITVSWAFDEVGIGSFRALQAPFLIDSYALERKVLDSDIPPKMLAGLTPEGLVGLGVLPGPLRRLLSYSRPLLAVSGYQGARIGINPSDVSDELFRTLGATPVVPQRGNVVSAGEDVAGLGGIEADITGIDAGLDTPGSTLTANVVFWPHLHVVFMNRRAFESLTAGQRSDLSRAAAVARDSEIWPRSDATSMRDLCHRSIKLVTASPADLTGLLAAARPVYQRLESDPETKAFIDQITSMRQAIGGSPEPVTCRAAGTASRRPGSATLLEGTWEVTYTEADLVAAGASSGELQPSEGNWGHFTLTFRQGHWWQRVTDSEGSPNNLFYYGTYVVTGHEINFYRHDHDYATSDTEVWGPYIWSVYRDTLTFKQGGPGFVGGLGWVLKPWRKIGT